MKLSKKKLQSIINEEISSLLQERIEFNKIRYTYNVGMGTVLVFLSMAQHTTSIEYDVAMRLINEKRQKLLKEEDKIIRMLEDQPEIDKVELRTPLLQGGKQRDSSYVDIVSRIAVPRDSGDHMPVVRILEDYGFTKEDF